MQDKNLYSKTKKYFFAAFFSLGLVTAGFGVMLFSMVGDDKEVVYVLPPLPDKASQVLGFWFGSEEGVFEVDEARVALWEQPNETQVEYIKTNFGVEINVAKEHGLDDWLKHPRGRLALILLLDQLADIISPNSKFSFDTDQESLGVALEGIRLNQDVDLSLVERAFFYHPLTEVESLEQQNRAVGFYERLYDVAPDEEKSFFETLLKKARSKRDIIYQFGRFPQYNESLNRMTTDQEQKYLNSLKSTNTALPAPSRDGGAENAAASATHNAPISSEPEPTAAQDTDPAQN